MAKASVKPEAKKETANQAAAPQLSDKQKKLLEKMNLKVEREIGSKFLGIKEGDTLIVEINSDITPFKTKKGEEYDYVEVTNLETGETGLKMWVSGQLRYSLREQKDGFIGGKCMIECTVKEQTEMEIDGKNQTVFVNQYKILALS